MNQTMSYSVRQAAKVGIAKTMLNAAAMIASTRSIYEACVGTGATEDDVAELLRDLVLFGTICPTTCPAWSTLDPKDGQWFLAPVPGYHRLWHVLDEDRRAALR